VALAEVWWKLEKEENTEDFDTVFWGEENKQDSSVRKTSRRDTARAFRVNRPIVKEGSGR